MGHAAICAQSHAILKLKKYSCLFFTEAIMIIFSAMRDFADGLTRGFSLFFTERSEYTARTMTPAPRPRKR